MDAAANYQLPITYYPSAVVLEKRRASKDFGNQFRGGFRC